MPIGWTIGFMKGSTAAGGGGGGSATASSAVSITFKHVETDSSDKVVYTFSSIPLGTGTVVVAAHVTDPSSPTSISGVTIAGGAATEIVERATGDAAIVGLWRRDVATSTGTITVTADSTAIGCGIAVYLVTGNGSPVPSNSGGATSSGTPVSVAATVPTNGAAIVATSYRDDTSGHTATPSNYTEQYDRSVDTSGTGNVTYMTGGTFSTSATVQTTATDADLGSAIVYAAWAV